MSTIASSRASLSTPSPPSSSRTSPDVPSTSQSRPVTLRRNRAALRDCCSLRGAVPADVSGGAQGESAEKESGTSETDKEGFDAEAYVQDVLEQKGLEGVLRVKAGLISGTSLVCR
ncbi:hypothetical protein LTR28_007679, partial [Elasticomyces elasticus]